LKLERERVKDKQSVTHKLLNGQKKKNLKLKQCKKKKKKKKKRAKPLPRIELLLSIFELRN
jgi:hypothetical protein